MSEYLLFLLLLSIPLSKGALFWRDRVLSRRRLRAWQNLASECGLQVVQAFARTPQLTAQAGPVAATIETAGGNQTARIVAWVPGPSRFYNVSIRREPLRRRAGEIEIGDRSFDSKFFLEGPTQQVLALLDAEMRRLLTCAMAESRLEVVGGLFRAEQTDDEKVPYVLPLLLDVNRRIAGPASIPRRLADNARGDPEPGERRKNLLCLIRQLPQAPETLEVVRAACADPSPEVRLQAAKALGAEGTGLLLDLAESQVVDDAVSAEAVSALESELSFERTKAILDHAVDGSRPKTARACLEALGKKGASPGQLSLETTVAGQLSLAEAGQLSLAQTEAGQLSLAQTELAVVPHPVGQLSLPPEELEPPARRAREAPGGRRV